MGFLNSVKSRIQGIVPSHGEEAYPDQENSYSEDTGSPFTAAEGIPLPHTDYWSENYPTTTYIDEKTHLLTSTTEGVTDIPDDMTIYSLYADRARRTGDGPLFHFKDNGRWVTKSANEALEDIRAAAKGLMHRGLKIGDRVAFMCRTSYEWDIVDAAVLSIGGVLSTIYDTDSAAQIRTIVNNSDAKVLIVQTRDMLERADGAIEDCRSLKHISCLENGALQELQAYGRSVSDEELDRRIASIKLDDLCTIVYTSGSTSAPKGVELTQRNLVAFALNINAFIPDLLNTDDGSILMFLPQAHVFARAINYGVVYSSIQVYIATGIGTLISDLQVAKPTIMIGVPRVFEKVYNAASQKAGHGIKGRIFASATKTARSYMADVSDNGKASFPQTVLHAAYGPLVYSSLKEALGGRAKWLVCGGAPIDPQLLSFFRGAGIPVYEGYGMTETSAPCTFNPLGTPFHAGSVGIAFPGFSIRISEEDEIQIRGEGAFRRYHKNDEATKQAFTDDGWIASGDLGAFTHDGFLYITGRKKDLIITAGGKNVSPTPIEEAIRRCPLVSQAVVLGDKRPFISALITLDEESLRDWLGANSLDRDMSLDDAADNAAVRGEIQKYVDLANEGVSRAESVRKFIVLPEDFSQDNGMLTASMKVIRPHVIKRYQKLLDTQMYTPRKKNS
ncbi:AMP-dependent synthetase/ligase [Scardovia wiggsiae]|uniref:AMP-dependent synthetase/ligase n=1 Tax=Scardovia wiggsiae TaxID=230143 RepID=UPI00374EA9D2